MLKDSWKDKINGESIVDAEDINEIAHSIINLEKSGGASIELAQDVNGDSTEKAVSQKAVKDALDKVRDDVETYVDIREDAIESRVALVEKRFNALGASYDFITDTPSANPSTVPSGVLPYAFVSKFGGAFDTDETADAINDMTGIFCVDEQDYVSSEVIMNYNAEDDCFLLNTVNAVEEPWGTGFGFDEIRVATGETIHVTVEIVDGEFGSADDSLKVGFTWENNTTFTQSVTMTDKKVTSSITNTSTIPVRLNYVLIGLTTGEMAFDNSVTYTNLKLRVSIGRRKGVRYSDFPFLFCNGVLVLGINNNIKERINALGAPITAGTPDMKHYNYIDFNTMEYVINCKLDDSGNVVVVDEERLSIADICMDDYGAISVTAEGELAFSESPIEVTTGIEGCMIEIVYVVQRG